MNPATPDRRTRTTVHDIGLASDVLTDGRAVVTLGPDATSVLIIQTRRGVFAMQNRCPHLGFSLDTVAAVRGRYVKCALHGREYDMTSGTCRRGLHPRTPRLPTYRAWIHHDHLFIALPTSAN
jgi:nitrite reductase/ring-hydroxylating ferredoxin subunit